MGHRPINPSIPTAGARAIVFRGDDAFAVAEHVRRVVADGLIVPAGPYRYPYAAIVELLRRAKLFSDPLGHTATDPVLRRETLTDLLRMLVRHGGRIGLLDADRLDHASAGLFGAFAKTARLAAEHGFDSTGLVLGTSGSLPSELQLESAEIHEVEAEPRPRPQLDAASTAILGLVAAAPHPVAESSLARLSVESLATLRSTLRRLATSELLELGPRIALAPGDAQAPDAAIAKQWLQTPEVQLPQARLAISGEPELAVHLALEALQADEADVAIHCFMRAGKLDAAAEMAFAEALARNGQPDAACKLFRRRLDVLPLLRAGVVAALLARAGSCPDETAEALLRRAERQGVAAAARPWRAGLMLRRGEAKSARNLLRRTTQAELSNAAPGVRMHHLATQAECMLLAGDETGAGKKFRAAATLCENRAQLRRVTRDPVAGAQLAAEDLDADALRELPQAVVHEALQSALPQTPPAVPQPSRSPAELYERLRDHGATLLAALVGDELMLCPPGAGARPGLAVTMEAKLRTLRGRPQVTKFAGDEFSGLGPYSGDSVLSLQSYAAAGPVIILFRNARLDNLDHLL